MSIDQNTTAPIVLVLTCLILFVNAVLFLALAVVFRPWLQAFLSGTPVTVFEVLGMRLRRTDTRKVLKSLIMAKHAGVMLSCRQAEQAYLQGVDLEKVTLALIRAKRQGVDVTFETLVAAELDGRLAEKLGEPIDSAAGTDSAGSVDHVATGSAEKTGRVCGKCAKRVYDDSKICRNCGAIL